MTNPTVNRDTEIIVSVNRCDRFIRIHEDDPLYKSIRSQYMLHDGIGGFIPFLLDISKTEGFDISVEERRRTTAKA